MAERVRREHDQIRERPCARQRWEAHALGELLNDHVRFEERELFELLESRLNPDELARLGQEIEASRDQPSDS